MSPSSSSTSNSEQPPHHPHRRATTWRGCAIALLWTATFLALGDVAINTLFAMPADPTQEPGGLQQFFDYGRSIEGKLRRMMGTDDGTTHPLLRAGWIEDNVGAPGEEGWSTGTVSPSPAAHAGEGRGGSEARGRADSQLHVAAYGMSFTFRICHRMRELEDGIVLRLLGAPAAPLSHSHALYLRDRGGRDADVVVLGILASSLPALHSTTHMTWNFEAPGAYTYPRYSLDEGQLVRADPPINSLEELRAALNDPGKWSAFRDHLRRHDVFISAMLFDASALDRSAIARCIRRALAQRQKRADIAKVHDAGGFRDEGGIVDVARALALDFAKAVREDGATPVILLLNDQGYADHLYRALGPALAHAGVAFVSTHEIAPADDPSNFIADSHFADAMELAIARRLLVAIRER